MAKKNSELSDEQKKADGAGTGGGDKRTLFAVVIEDPDTTKALEYFIDLEIVNFADDLKKQTQIDGGPPFNIDPPPF